jgi:CheY-like chemotaxis protein
MTASEKPTGDENQASNQTTPPAMPEAQAAPATPEKATEPTKTESPIAETPAAVSEKTTEVRAEAVKEAETPKADQSPAEPAAAKPEETKPQKTTPPAGEKPEAKPDAPKKKVLIVEDTTELAEVMEATLQRMGITTKHETHATKALEVFKEYHPDLILLDIGLPDMSGWKLLDTIKEIQKENRPHIVVITAYGDPANRLMGKLQDVTSYLIKPFSPDDVERVVRKVLGISPESKT